MLKITTKTAGWQKHCWDWVKAGEQFELAGVQAAHFLFCHALCVAYKYDHQFSAAAVMVFIPRNLSDVATPPPPEQFEANRRRREKFILSCRPLQKWRCGD